MKVAYVEYLYPGAFVAESSVVPDDGRAIPKGAVGYRKGSRTEIVQDGETLTGPYKWGPYTYVGTVETIDAVRARGPSILLSNMEGNKWDRVVKVRGATYPLNADETVIAP